MRLFDGEAVQGRLGVVMMSDNQESQATRNHNPANGRLEETPKVKGVSFAIPVLGIVASLAVAAYIIISGLNELPAPPDLSKAHRADSQKVSPSEAGDITIPFLDVSKGKAKFFDYTTSDNRSVRFFVSKSPDGAFYAALDACRVCTGSKGYYQIGDDLICGTCGSRFPLSSINEVAGDCGPVGLPQMVEGDHLVIKVSDLESRKTYF